MKNFDIEEVEEEQENEYIIEELKKDTKLLMIKIKILTIFKDWSFPKVKKHFDASTHMITVAKQLATKEYCQLHM